MRFAVLSSADDRLRGLPRKRLSRPESRIFHLHLADVEAVLLRERRQRLALQVDDDGLDMVAQAPELALLRDLRH